MKKLIEWLAVIVLVVVSRLLVNFFFPGLAYWLKFVMTIVLGVLALVSAHLVQRKIKQHS